MKIVNLFFLFLLFAKSSLASQISLSSVIVDFNQKNDMQYYDLSVKNVHQEEKAYVKVTPHQVINPGKENEVKVTNKTISLANSLLKKSIKADKNVDIENIANFFSNKNKLIVKEDDSYFKKLPKFIKLKVRDKEVLYKVDKKYLETDFDFSDVKTNKIKGDFINLIRELAAIELAGTNLPQRNIGLIVSPQKLAISVGGKKNIRIIPTAQDLKTDNVYRIHVAPVAGSFESDSKTFIKVLVAYDVLTFVRPKNEDPNFTVKRKGKKMSFENKGNTNILIKKAHQCSSKYSQKDCKKLCLEEDEARVHRDLRKCKLLPGFRLYSNNKVTKELPFDNEITYFLQVVDNSQIKTYQ